MSVITDTLSGQTATVAKAHVEDCIVVLEKFMSGPAGKISAEPHAEAAPAAEPAAPKETTAAAPSEVPATAPAPKRRATSTRRKPKTRGRGRVLRLEEQDLSKLPEKVASPESPDVELVLTELAIDKNNPKRVLDPSRKKGVVRLPGYEAQVRGEVVGHVVVHGGGFLVVAPSLQEKPSTHTSAEGALYRFIVLTRD
ncbi:hypothetical protein [Bosea sp. ANAM02]|uniref:hypothetical protein n=1 Tax=Bosea sp. ANAM02 TaxID=2020412 RepID=UPI0015672042|nr:hypothetical protein [Bosea sp. ANAM02]